jgi:hypothetical protein
MAISAIKEGYMVKSVLFISFLFVISLGLIGGCSDGGGGNNSQALTENDFAEDSSLRANLKGVVVTFLESPMSEEAENDTGEVGIDLIPVAYRRTTEQTFCWEDDNANAMHFMELRDSQGNLILTVEANGDCVEEVIEEGDYVLSIHHDGSVEDSLPVFLSRNTDVFRDHARGERDNIPSFIDVERCLFNCDLRRADFRGANLRNVDLTGADLRNADFTLANLTGANLTGVDLTNSDLSDATWCDGICRCLPGSIGRCIGCSPVDEVCTGP